MAFMLGVLAGWLSCGLIVLAVLALFSVDRDGS